MNAPILVCIKKLNRHFTSALNKMCRLVQFILLLNVQE